MSAATTGRTSRLTALYRSSRARVIVGFAVAAVLLFAVAPATLSTFRLGLLGKFLCLAMVAVGIGLAWGRGGMLTLGQGVFFGLGAYIMAMHLKLADAGPGGVPDFMMLYGSGEVPGWWEPFRSPVVTILAIAVVPAGLAALLGFAVFTRRVRGAYFAILSQALAAAFAILLIGQQATTGGTNGLNGFRSFFGYDLADPVNKRMLFFLAAGALLVMVAVARQLMVSRFGELLVAVRDQENRVRFLGYDPAQVKVVAYAVAAFMAAVGGALFVPIVGIISPADVGVVPSIGFLIGVAIGGRATLLGPVVGSIAVSWAQTSLSEAFPSGWIYAQGALFILVVAFLPGGLAELFTRWRRSRRGSVPDGGAPAPGDDGTSDGSRPGAARTGEPGSGNPTVEPQTAVDHDPATSGRTA
ncbi:urea ABC transporter permease subunit UrtC [Cellulosimicrobium cellulans]|uniref:urea ABC transporter permease subunit UrtC n=1 Tax=Cellulosimicrobium cellulans TaxID=1710 RepID=UPI001965718F|nr:urea ABC transporter permease subunit UrtC [Cellulosimicrobium cellulans]MBN0041884.1 urea ABC transporter permease subunit UrtC [Cellulosimicrobium cellulans]